MTTLRGFRLGLTVAAISAGSVLLFATRWGIGVSYDSVFYLSAADNLLHGYGLSRLGGGGEVIPLTHFPPLYPLVLAAGGWVLPWSSSVVARWLAAALFAGLVLLAGLIVRKFTNSAWAGVGTAVVVLSSPVFLDVDAWAMSEALYLVCSLSALWLLATYVARPGWSVLLWAGLVAGAAYATRYVGASLLATGMVVIWMAGGVRWPRRLLRVGVYAGLGALPVLAWMTRNALLTGLTTNRILIFHPLGRAKLSEAAHALASFILPDGISFWLRFVIMLVGLACLAVYWLRAFWTAERRRVRSWDAPTQLAGVLILHALVYASLLSVSLSFFDASTRLDERILSPLWLVAILLAGLLGARWAGGARPSEWPRVMASGIFVGVVALGGARSLTTARTAHANGLGFNSRGWVTSPTVAWVEALDVDASLTSNEAFPLYYRTGRPVYWAPEAIDPVKGEPRADLQDALEAMRARLRQPDAYLVIFHPDHLRVEMPPQADLTDGLTQVQTTSDAVIYTGQ
jgi:hypothetical protein